MAPKFETVAVPVADDYTPLPWSMQTGMNREQPRPYVCVRGNHRTVAVDVEDLDEVIWALIEAQAALMAQP